MAKVTYDDGKYVVTDAVVSTPRRFYPIAHTTASIRRDPLWAALGIVAFTAASLAVYGDLLHGAEKIALVLISSAAIVVGWRFSILAIDAIGHRRAFIIARADRIHGIYLAIRDVRGRDDNIPPSFFDNHFRNT